MSVNPFDYSETPMTLHKTTPRKLHEAAGFLAQAHYNEMNASRHDKLAANAEESRVAAFHEARANHHEDRVIKNMAAGKIATGRKTSSLNYSYPGYSHYMDN